LTAPGLARVAAPCHKKLPMAASDVERIFVRDELLELAGERLFEQVSRCRKRLPLSEIAGFIEGDGKRASRVVAGPRQAIADILRKRFSNAQTQRLAALVMVNDPGRLTCAFVVRLGGGAIDVSVVALDANHEDEERDVPEPPPPPPLSPEQEARIAAHTRERDEILLDPDLSRLRRHLAKSKPAALHASDEVMLAAWHKARTAATSLPLEERQKSVEWLEDRGMEHFADGELEEPS
jgi:hypothetical protein